MAETPPFFAVFSIIAADLDLFSVEPDKIKFAVVNLWFAAIPVFLWLGYQLHDFLMAIVSLGFLSVMLLVYCKLDAALYNLVRSKFGKDDADNECVARKTHPN